MSFIRHLNFIDNNGSSFGIAQSSNRQEVVPYTYFQAINKGFVSGVNQGTVSSYIIGAGTGEGTAEFGVYYENA